MQTVANATNFLTARFDGAYAQFTTLPDPETTEVIKESLSFSDKSIEFQNKRDGTNYDSIVRLYDPRNGTFPTGLLPRVGMVLKSREIGYELSCYKTIGDAYIQRFDLSQEEPFPGYRLWDHQVEGIETALRLRRCCLEIPTGGGKTVMLAEIAKHFPYADILVTASSSDVMRNNADTIEHIIGEKVGRVGDGKRDYRRVTSATLQTLVRDIGANPRGFDNFQVHLVDECQFVGYHQTARLVFGNLRGVDFRVGVSATAWREGGDTLAMEGYIGPLAYQIKEEELQRKGILVPFDFCSIYIPAPKDPVKEFANTKKERNGKPNRDAVYDHLITKNQQRNNAVAQLVKAHRDRGCPYGPCLIVTGLIDHSKLIYDLLCQFLTPEEEVELVYGKTGKTKRKEVIDRLRSSDLRFVVANQIFNVGVDFPPAGLLINTSGGSAQSALIQKIGRVIRKAEGKDHALVIDFEDGDPFYLRQNYYNRTRALKERYPSTKKEEKHTVSSIIKKFYD
ncbi:MAG: DEAD/DEAH box helicase [Halobacteria archaeon]